MVLRVVAHLSETDEGKHVELDDFSLLFFETCLAELKSQLRIDPAVTPPYDYFEYKEDGYPCNVKTDTELQSLHESPPEIPLHVWLKSSRQLPNKISDEYVLDSSDFVFEYEIAHGQFGTVYRAEDVRNGRIIAVKSIMANPEMSKMQQEVDILSKGRECPYIVEFFGAIFEEDHIKIIMEYMDGLSLDKYEPLPIDVHGSASVSICHALSFLWSKNIIHRDIKPSNFLVNSNGDVKLADFGVSRSMELFSNAYTGVGTVIYLSPERIRGGAYSIASDVWSLGLSFTEMALGTSLWGSQNESENNAASDFSRHILENLPELFNRIGSIDMDLRTLVSGCLKPTANERIAFYALQESRFIQKYTPVNKQIVANFIQNALTVDAGFI